MSLCGLLAVGGCQAPKIKEYEDEGLVELSAWGDSVIAISSLPYRVIFRESGSDCFAECSTHEGMLHEYSEKEMHKQTTVAMNGTMLVWTPQGETLQKDYIDIVMKDDDGIFGYAVIAIRPTQSGNYYATVLKAATFQEDGVTKAQVNRLIADMK